MFNSLTTNILLLVEEELLLINCLFILAFTNKWLCSHYSYIIRKTRRDRDTTRKNILTVLTTTKVKRNEQSISKRQQK